MIGYEHVKQFEVAGAVAGENDFCRRDGAIESCGGETVKNGFPVPAARITARPFSRCRTARRRINGSHTLYTLMADCTRVGCPIFSIVSCSATAFSTVASIPM